MGVSCTLRVASVVPVISVFIILLTIVLRLVEIVRGILAVLSRFLGKRLVIRLGILLRNVVLLFSLLFLLLLLLGHVVACSFGLDLTRD